MKIIEKLGITYYLPVIKHSMSGSEESIEPLYILGPQLEKNLDWIACHDGSYHTNQAQRFEP